MKLIDHASKWGNMFRHRYYINGYRVKEQEFNYMFKSLSKEYPYERKYESDNTTFRITYQFSEESIPCHAT